MTYRLMQDAAIALEHSAGLVRYHASRKSVTHTLKAAKSTTKALIQVFKNIKMNFKRDFENALFNAQIGPTEIRFGKGDQSDEVFIQGTFSVDALRGLFVVGEADHMLEVVGKQK